MIMAVGIKLPSKMAVEIENNIFQTKISILHYLELYKVCARKLCRTRTSRCQLVARVLLET